MANIRIKKGLNLNIEGAISEQSIAESSSKNFAVVPDDFPGITPRLDVKEGELVEAGSVLFHDKNAPEIVVTSPVSGKVVEISRGARRKIEAVKIEAQGIAAKKFDLNRDVKQLLLESGLWCVMRQRPYDYVPNPNVEPRDIFVTCFDSAPLAPDFALLLKGKENYLQKGVDALASLTDGNVYLGCKPDCVPNVKGCVVNTFEGPHPAGNVGVQIANVKPVNKSETVWTLDAV